MSQIPNLSPKNIIIYMVMEMVVLWRRQKGWERKLLD